MKHPNGLHIPGAVVPIENHIGRLRWPTKMRVFGRMVGIFRHPR